MMNINCIICSDPIIASSEIYSTQCGHLFHYSCLIQWIERSKSCPQCRQRCTEKTIHRIYFNVANTDNIVDDVVSLQLKLDSAHFELKLKQKDLQNHINRYSTAKAQNCELRKEISKLEQQVHTLEQTHSQLRDQLQFHKAKSKDNQKLNDIVIDLRQQIKNYESIKLVIDGTREDCNDLLRENNDVESLKLLIITLKKALVDSEHKKLRYEHRYRNIQTEISQFKRDLIGKDQELSEIKHKFDLNEKNWNLEKIEMKKLIEKLNIDKNDSLANRVVLESPMPLKRTSIKVKETPNDIVKDNSTDGNQTESPYLQIKSTAYNYFLNNPSKVRLLRTDSRLKHTQSMDFDGMGGHEKSDEFPTPKLRSIGLKRRVTTAANMSAKCRKLAPIATNKSS